MGQVGESHGAAFESLLRQIARAPGYELQPPAVAIAPGAMIAGRFEVVREIGSGGFARVFQARDQLLARDVALKVLHRQRRLSDRELELFFREARATARLNHPNIVTAYDWGESDGVPFLVLELLDGEPLSALIKAGPIGEDRALAIARDLAAALCYAHKTGVLHLDLKAQNIVVLPGGGIKVLDFGLAGLEWGEGVPTGAPRIVGGTPATMAPEQRQGGATDPRTDVWAVGVVLHELLFGRLPRIDRNDGAAEIDPTASNRCAAILAKSLAADPDDRFAGTAVLLEAIEDARRPRRRRIWLAATAGSLAAAALALAIFAGASPAATPNVSSAPWPPPITSHRQLTFTGDVLHSDLSPGGDKIAYVTSSGRELWVKAVDGDEAARKIFEDEELQHPRWLADGERIVVANMKRGTWLVAASGGAATRLPMRPSRLNASAGGDSLATTWVDDPRVRVGSLWSAEATSESELPPQTRLVFDIDVARDGKLLVATFDGRGRVLQRLPGGTFEELCHESQMIVGARWSGDGRGVFYTVDPGPEARLRYIATASGARPATVVGGGGVGDRLAVSRDGRRLLYHQERRVRHIVRLTAAGEISPITRGTAEVMGAAVASDGRTLAFTVREGDRYSIRIGPIEPGVTRARIPCQGPCGSPAWSGDGQRLAIRERARDGEWRIVVVVAAGTGERVVYPARATQARTQTLAWLSDTEIIYVPSANGPLRVLDLETGRDRSFLHRETRGWMLTPSPSSDGARVAYFWHPGPDRGRGDVGGVYVAARDGSNPRLVMPDAGRAYFPIAWTDDDRQLLALELASDSRLIRYVEISIASGDIEAIWSPPGEVADVTDDVVAIPGNRDLLVLRTESRSDAWLIEDPRPPKH